MTLADELRGHRLRYEADQALQNIAYLHAAAGRLTRFADIAAKLGSDHWLPIVTLAQAAIARNRPDIARAVFQAADQPGRQREYVNDTDVHFRPLAARRLGHLDRRVSQAPARGSRGEAVLPRAAAIVAVLGSESRSPL